MTALSTPVTTAPTTRTSSRYRLSFGRVIRSEWIKLLSLRSTWWSLGVTVLLSVGISLMIASASSAFGPEFPAVQVIVMPMQFTMLVAGILGAIAVTGEYSTGMIRSTLTAEPRRGVVLAAKAIVVGAVMALTTVVTFAIAVVATAPLLGDLSIDWSDPAVSTIPLLLAVFAMAVFALIGVGFGFIVRNGAGAIAATVGLLFVMPIVVSMFTLAGESWKWIVDAGGYLPMAAAQLATTAGGDEVLRGTLTLAAWPVALLLLAWGYCVRVMRRAHVQGIHITAADRIVTMLTADTAPTDPTFWESVGTVLVQVGLKLIWIVVIVVLAILASWILRVVIRRVVKRIVAGAKSKANVDDTQALERSPLANVRVVQRTRTLGSILQNIVNVTIVVVATMMIVLTINPTILGSFTLLGAALGAGLGFGAQNIVKDVLNGMFIVAEDQIGIGDVVDLGLATGIVEYVAIRVTHVRDVNGTLWYVRNGEITRIGNMSQGWSRVIIDLAVPTDADIHAVEKTMHTAAKSLYEDPKWRSRVLEQPEVWGLESITGDALVIRLVMKTRANAKDDVARELRMRLKGAMDDMGLTLPSMNSITLSGLEGAQRVRGANPPKTKPTPVTAADAKPVWKPKRGTGSKPEEPTT